MSRPTDEVIEEAEWIETGRCGCLIPDDELTEGTESEEDD
jgi:hypothetical protein